jgi:ribosomal protein S18 acetylase RimI-like enzyme
VLIPAVLGWARQAGYPAISLWVTIDNKPAQDLYARHGFRATGAIQPVRPAEPDHLEQEMRHTLVTA